MRGGRSTLILVAVFLGMLGYYVYDSRRDPAPAADEKPKAFTVEADKIEELTVKAPGGETTKLRKGSAGWEMVEPTGTPADQTEATSIAQTLSTLEIQRVIDENASELAQYGLAEPKVEIEFRASGQKAPTRLQLGDKTPTGGELYAKTPDSKRVFLIASYLDSTVQQDTIRAAGQSRFEVRARQGHGPRNRSPEGCAGICQGRQRLEPHETQPCQRRLQRHRGRDRSNSVRSNDGADRK